MLSRQNGTGVEAFIPFFMLTLLAESKTMSTAQFPVPESDYEAHCPVLEPTADSIMEHISSLPTVELADTMGVSMALAVKAHNLAYDFPHKQTGIDTIHAFMGDAYRGFDVSTLPKEFIKKSDSYLRIISSVYGILKPSDIIKPYRCEFNKPIAPGGKTPIQVFKPKVTVEFVKYIRENKVGDIIDLLPADADKCLDWKIIRAFSRVHKVVFQTPGPNGKMKTPIAKRLKELRGLMARTILEHSLNSFEELTSFQSDEFIYSPTDSKPGLPVFVC